MNTIPNLDAMTADELMSFWGRYRFGERAACAELIGDKRKGYTLLAGNLGAYAINKATAMACRVRGDIPAALIYEKICDHIYDDLPDDCRW